jgi:hypothetical protein
MNLGFAGRSVALLGIVSTALIPGCATAPDRNESVVVDHHEDVAFLPCLEPVTLEEPSDQQFLERFADAWQTLPPAPSLAAQCVFAPGATMSLGPLSTDPEPFDLAAFWQGLSSAGTYADSASPYGAVRMADGDSEIVLAYLFADIGLPPILAHYELIDGHWLVTWLQSGLACEDLRADILERVSTDTCPR